MKMLKKLAVVFAAVALIAGSMALTGCSPKDESSKVIIYSSAEEYRLVDLRARLKEEFPDYEVLVEYKGTGDLAAKVASEGKDSEIDIVYELDYAYFEKIAADGILADLSEYGTSEYVEDAVQSKYYMPSLRNGGAIILNPDKLKEKGLEAPESYEDLLKPEYKGLVSMPSPKSSGTGYIFLKALVNEWGEEEAFEYFDKLNENIPTFQSSGSGPVNELILGNAAIGLGMTAQAVTAINDGSDFEIRFFSEGSPFSLYGQAIIAGKEQKKPVKDVFDFLVNKYTRETNQKFFPEIIFKDGASEIKNYPNDIKYSDMSNNSSEEKARLLDKWKY